ADYVRVRDEQRAAEAPVAEPKAQRARAKPVAKAAPPRPSELERLETEIAGREATVAAPERRLAEDWSNVETLAAHQRARDELQSLLERWETLFESAQT